MAKTITIQISEDLERKLTAQAQKLNLSLEHLVITSLEQSVAEVELDPSDPLMFILMRPQMQLPGISAKTGKIKPGYWLTAPLS